MHTQPTTVAQAARGAKRSILLIALALALILAFLPALNAAQAQDFVGEDDAPPYFVLRGETVVLWAPGELLKVNVSGFVDSDCHPRRRTTQFITHLVLFNAAGDILTEAELSVPQNGFATAEIDPADLHDPRSPTPQDLDAGSASAHGSQDIGVRVETPVCDPNRSHGRSSPTPALWASLEIIDGETGRVKHEDRIRQLAAAGMVEG